MSDNIGIYTLPPIIMEVENGALKDEWLVSKGVHFSTSMIVGKRVDPKVLDPGFQCLLTLVKTTV